MTPKDHYLNLEDSLDELSFKEAERVDESVLRQGSLWELPEDNLCGFKGARGQFEHAKQRLSDNGEWILIASLAGSVKVQAAGVDLASPVGLVCIYGDDWRMRQSSVTSVGRDWAPMSERAKGRLHATWADGFWRPIARSIVMRGLHGTTYEHRVVLPSIPESVVGRAGKAYLACKGVVFVLEDPLQVQAALEGTATWIVPNELGDFVYQKI